MAPVAFCVGEAVLSEDGLLIKVRRFCEIHFFHTTAQNTQMSKILMFFSSLSYVPLILNFFS